MAMQLKVPIPPVASFNGLCKASEPTQKNCPFFEAQIFDRHIRNNGGSYHIQTVTNKCVWNQFCTEDPECEKPMVRK